MTAAGPTAGPSLELDHVAIGDGPGAALPAVSAVAGPGTPGVVAVETEQAPVLASLVAGGRMRPESGRVLLDGHDDTAAVRRAIALVDTPGVAEPFAVLTVRQVVREELALAGRRSGRDAVDTVLDAVGADALGDTPMQRVPTALRVRVLVELALLRPDVTGIVLTSPERHGGAVDDWFAVVREIARRDVTVLVVTSKAAAATVEHLLAVAGSAPPADATAPPADTTAPPADTTAPPADATAPRADATVSAGAEPGLPSGALAAPAATDPLEARP